jgi:hypothetical protein
MGYAITFIAGLILLIIGLVLLRNRITFIKNGMAAVATVKELKEVTDSDDNSISYKPIFTFTTYNNEKRIHEHNVSSRPSSWSVGDTVKVIYEKDNPAEVVVLTYFSAFGLVAILLSLALALVCFSAGYYWCQHFFNSL